VADAIGAREHRAGLDGHGQLAAAAGRGGATTGWNRGAAVIVLVALLTLLLSLNAWLLEPLVQGITTLLELPVLPWFALGIGAWLLAGERQRP
jgi:hypothetical protein